MSSEKRLLLFMVLTVCSFLAIQYVMEVTGLAPPPPKPPPKAQAKAENPADAVKKANPPAKAKAARKDEVPEKLDAERPKVALVEEGEMVLGSTRDKSPAAYRLEIQFEQKGAGVSSIASSQYDADREGHRLVGKPLQVLQYDPTNLPSLALSLKVPEIARAAGAPIEAEVPLAETLWEVVRDERNRIVRPLTKTDPLTKAPVEGQEIVFRTTVDELAGKDGKETLILTKTFRLWKGQDGFEMDLGFESPQKDRSVVYRLFGPHNIPIEGESYTGMFRDVFFGQAVGNEIKLATRSAAEIAKDKATPFENTTNPLAFAGIENQYFAVFIEPVPIPQSPDARWDDETVATVIHVDKDATQKADVSFEMVSKAVKVGPNVPVTHTYRVYAGPKTIEALMPVKATVLASYHKSQWFSIPFAPWMAMNVITPLLDNIYGFTTRVSRLFGGQRGNYGISIILLTLLVRMMMFPLGRKQALAAKKMQDLQPLLKELQEKYKDDKERQTRETFALYKKHGVNPVGGCLPALIQLPIFVGLWQALNNSVHLRHAPFLWIENLAAPDMIWKFPGEVPFLGHYLNILPFAVVGLMLVQTKLFAPPATTPEAEMQQKTMKIMMVVMGFMFYRVPSGLGFYFITSSLWQIGERLLLPKVSHQAPVVNEPGGDKEPPAGGGKGGPGGGGRGGPGGGGKGGPPAPKPRGKIAELWERVKEEATKDSTYRNIVGGNDDREKRDKDKPRARPGRRR